MFTIWNRNKIFCLLLFIKSSWSQIYLISHDNEAKICSTCYLSDLITGNISGETENFILFTYWGITYNYWYNSGKSRISTRIIHNVFQRVFSFVIKYQVLWFYNFPSPASLSLEMWGVERLLQRSSTLSLARIRR